MTRKHFEFINSVQEFLISYNCKLVEDLPFRYKKFKYEEVEFIVPHVQKYTFSVHIYLKDGEYNFHSKEINYIKAIEKFKEHTKILWQ